MRAKVIAYPLKIDLYLPPHTLDCTHCKRPHFADPSIIDQYAIPHPLSAGIPSLVESPTPGKVTNSIAPRSFSISAKTFRVVSRSATLQLYATAFMPSFSQAAFVASWLEEVRSRRARLAPVLARESAIAAPIPG
jgi:hypothetical protein